MRTMRTIYLSLSILLLADIESVRIKAEIGTGFMLIIEQGILLIGNAL